MTKCLFSKKIICIIFVLTLCGLLFTGCSNSTSSSSKTVSKGPSKYHRITPQQAKEMLDADSKIILIDLRSIEDYKIGHIEGAVSVPYEDAVKKITQQFTNRNAKILIYSNSKNRSAITTLKLIQQKYVNVYDFGDIVNWPYSLVTK